MDTHLVIRPYGAAGFQQAVATINEAAVAYRGVVPVDRWTEPYMTANELRHEIASGVQFWVAVEHDVLVGVMGLQYVADVALIRHAYRRPDVQGKGIGAALLPAR